MDITAYDEHDAVVRVAKLGALQLQGELMMTIPASLPLTGWFTRTICNIKNWRARIKLYE